MEALPVIASLGIFILAILLILAPIFIWHNIAKLREEQKQQMQQITRLLAVINSKLGRAE